MKLTQLTRVPVPPSNLTNEELARWVRNEFPNLTGSLAMMQLRFEKGKDALCDQCPQTEREPYGAPGDVAKCPCCGTELEISEAE